MTASEHEMPKDVVPPGSRTGIYYIPISNLPFNTSWQQIKDYVRQVCEVDHVELFQRSTSGWVRVKGRKNFEAAFGLLNGNEFNGRAIIAEGKNADNPILVRDLMACKSKAASSNRSLSGGTAPSAVFTTPEQSSYVADGSVYHPNPSLLASPVSPTSSSFNKSGDGRTTSMPSSSLMTSPDPSYAQAITTTYDQFSAGFSYSPPMSLHSFGADPSSSLGAPASFLTYAASLDVTQQYDPATSYPAQTPYSRYYPQAMTSLNSQMAAVAFVDESPTGAGIYTEQRGIQIRNISNRASDSQIRRMVRDWTGPEANLISEICIPSAKEGKTRGLAFVRFHTADLAKRMETSLDGVEFRGRKLQVRLMKEGEVIYGSGEHCSPAAGSPKPPRKSRQPHQHQHHHQPKTDDKRRDERKERIKPDRTSTSSSKTSPPSPSSSGDMPLVVGGGGNGIPVQSAASTSAHCSSKGKGRRGKETSVVVADGSSDRKS
ncbi:hypothetical protein M406DRAFT_325421 [Cryphonectria parasitica EP155]|uniref:RRM domain-containing protein n=1 Tax=Cryphonectria parasitica (strain ATCC 38755 / EP155) TaxID=660469 RepID=A0A9P5CTZ0_CRYP1|nr:uncharacterized protein M406DRAFT_325421 [Cryphonectria parasitica EP155]KAF3769941.1 hypothetical protein M406DRAFT_325421 [Cryphonectria parasitica EP155]